MYLKCDRHVNSKFSLCQSPVRANSKNKTEEVIYWGTVLLFTLALLLPYIINHSSNVNLIKGRFRNSVTFQTKCLAAKGIAFQQLIVVWNSSILDLEDFCIKFNVTTVQYTYQTFIKYFCFRENKLSLVFNQYIGKDLNLKAFWSHLQQCNWKKHDYMENEGVFSLYVIFADISKIDLSF